MNARTVASHSAPQQKIWLVDFGATNHITSDILNLQEVIIYPSSETVTCVGGKGLIIANIGNTCISTPQHNFHLKSVLYMPQLSQHLCSMYQLCRDNKS